MLLGRFFLGEQRLWIALTAFSRQLLLPGGCSGAAVTALRISTSAQAPPGKLGELLERVLTNTFDGFNKYLLSGMPSTSDRVPARANRSKQHDTFFVGRCQ